MLLCNIVDAQRLTARSDHEDQSTGRGMIGTGLTCCVGGTTLIPGNNATLLEGSAAIGYRNFNKTWVLSWDSRDSQSDNIN